VREAPAAEVATAWMAAMRRGDWEEAWRQTDRIELPRRARQGRPEFVREPQHLRWDGTPFEGRRVLVRCEHGLGDTLQFMRFVPQLAAIAREVHVMVQPALLDLFAGAPQLGTVHNGWTQWWPPPPHEVEVEVMELAYALRATLDTLPPPCLHLRDRVAGKLPVELPRNGDLRVGLLWAASDWDASRSMPPELLMPLLQRAGHVAFSVFSKAMPVTTHASRSWASNRCRATRPTWWRPPRPCWSWTSSSPSTTCWRTSPARSAVRRGCC